MNKMTKIALLTSGLLLGTSTLAQAAPVKIAVLMYGMKAEFVQLMEKAAKEHPEVKNGNVQLTVYDGRYDHGDSYVVAESLIEFDELFQKFRAHHIYLVHRSIGMGSKAISGRAVDLLDAGARHRFGDDSDRAGSR